MFLQIANKPRLDFEIMEIKQSCQGQCRPIGRERYVGIIDEKEQYVSDIEHLPIHIVPSRNEAVVRNER